jgi:hypothetical protein
MASAVPDEGQLKAEIEQTRERLGATVEQLAAKADVKSRARAKASEVAGRVKDATARGRKQATRPTRQAVAKGTDVARDYRVPLSLGAVALVTAYLAWRWRKR